MTDDKDINIKKVIPGSSPYADRDIYRNNIKTEGKYCFRLDYKYSGLHIVCDRDIESELEEPVRSFYSDISKASARQPGFEKSLSPLDVGSDPPLIVKEMCDAGKVFNVGPMASVAGALCDHLARRFEDRCSFLMIENGGDVYIKTDESIEVGIYTENTYFKDRLVIRIDASQTPCGICSSSGNIGHSLSLGKSDLVTVMSRRTTIADAAATAIANIINKEEDIDKAIEYFKNSRQIDGLIMIKDKRIGLWGQIRLTSFN